jgi:hypothetical protein
MDKHSAMELATPEGIAYFRQLNPDYVWLPVKFVKLRDWLAANGYRIDLQTDISFVAARADQRVIAPYSGSVVECFPGP